MKILKNLIKKLSFDRLTFKVLPNTIDYVVEYHILSGIHSGVKSVGTIRKMFHLKQKNFLYVEFENGTTLTTLYTSKWKERLQSGVLRRCNNSVYQWNAARPSKATLRLLYQSIGSAQIADLKEKSNDILRFV